MLGDYQTYFRTSGSFFFFFFFFFFYLSFCSKTNKIIVFFCVNKISMRYYFHLVHTSIFRIKVQINYAVYGHMDTSMEDMIISSHN